MANVFLSSLVLHDTFPGSPNPNLGIPQGGWDNTTDNCVTAATYPVGTKIQAYTDNTNCPGYYTMMYAGFASLCAAADISGDFSDGQQFCMPCALTGSTNDTTYEIPDYSGDISVIPCTVLVSCFSAADPDGALAVCWSTCQKVALPCATLEGYDYGWFWVGGVCPCADVTILKGTADSLQGADITTDGVVQKGSVWLRVGDSTWAAAYVTSADWSTYVGTCNAQSNAPTPFAHCRQADS